MQVQTDKDTLRHYLDVMRKQGSLRKAANWLSENEQPISPQAISDKFTRLPDGDELKMKYESLKGRTGRPRKYINKQAKNEASFKAYKERHNIQDKEVILPVRLEVILEIMERRGLSLKDSVAAYNQESDENRKPGSFYARFRKLSDDDPIKTRYDKAKAVPGKGVSRGKSA
ncbi:MAG: hypothetical protein ACKPCP_38185 [Sphaerospermopsis kisseleviana]